MGSQQEEVSDLSQLPSPRAAQVPPKKFTPKPRRSFTTAREYRKLFVRKEVQVFKKQGGQEIQEPRRVVQVVKALSDQEFQEEAGQNF